nr:hypothetical protein [uncultured Gemmiger sp.]
MCLLACAIPVQAQAADDFDSTLDELNELQSLAESYADKKGNDTDPIELMLAYTRMGAYNDTVWQLTAGSKDPDFETYVLDNNSELSDLMGMGTLTLPNGQDIDFGHLLASINLVYRGVPITGSWGGDCMELAQQYSGQASDVDGYITLMQESFGSEGDDSTFGAQDLRADLDSVIIGSQLTADTNLSDLIRSYYADLTDYDRAYQFIALSFGSVKTGDTTAFRDTVYNTLVSDAGMQLLLYLKGMWSADGWTIQSDAEPALQGAAYVFADYLSATVNGEDVKSDGSALKAMSGQSLADALNALGESDAANAALGALSGAADAANSSSGAVSDALDEATASLKSGFNAQIFQLILLVIAAAALFGMIVFLVLMSKQTKPRSRRRR